VALIGPAGASATSATRSWNEIASSQGGKIATGNSPVDVAISPDGTLAVSADRSGDTLSAFSVSGSGPGATFAPLPAPVIPIPPAQPPDVPIAPTAVAFSPEGGLLAVAVGGSTGAGLYLFQVTGSGPGATFALKSQTETASIVSLSDIAFNSDGSMLVVGGRGGGISSVGLVAISGATLEFATRVPLDPFGEPGVYNLRHVAFSPVGSLVVATSDYGSVGELAPFAVSGAGKTAKLVRLPKRATGSNPQGVAFSPDGSLIAVADGGPGTASIFAVEGSGTAAVVTKLPSQVTGGLNPQGVAFSPDGSLLAATNSGSDSLTLFTVTGAGRAATLSAFCNARLAVPPGSGPGALAFNPGGDLLAIAQRGSDRLTVLAGSGTAPGCEGNTLGGGKVEPPKPPEPPVEPPVSTDPGDFITANFDGAWLYIRQRCPARFRPRCVGTAQATTFRPRKLKRTATKRQRRANIPKPMSRTGNATQRARHWKVVKLRVKPRFRARIEAFARTPSRRRLAVRVVVRARRFKHNKRQRFFNTYRVRTIRTTG
jgi:DNA-binding beta-propeller fold protein YncE